jgi:hypothetical protein
METDKAKKLAAVIFLTLLIWVWAYFALEEQDVVPGRLYISKEITPDLWVTFLDTPEPPISVSVTLKGPNSKIAELRRLMRGGPSGAGGFSLDFYYNPVDEKITEAGTYIWKVLDSLKNSDQTKGLGLTVVNCEPETVKVDIKKLVEKQLPVQCVDENNIVIEHENIEPAAVSVFVPQEWAGPATVVLTTAQIEQAREAPVARRPFVSFGSKPDYAETLVTVKLPAIGQTLSEAPVSVKIGFLVSENILGKYKIELRNEDELSERVMVVGTSEAIEAYEKKLYQILIEVRDGDEAATEEIIRDVIYNFPPEFVRGGQIQLKPAPTRSARFRLVPVTAP